jgi:hypothetical protein
MIGTRRFAAISLTVCPTVAASPNTIAARAFWCASMNARSTSVAPATRTSRILDFFDCRSDYVTLKEAIHRIVGLEITATVFRRRIVSCRILSHFPPYSRKQRWPPGLCLRCRGGQLRDIYGLGKAAPGEPMGAERPALANRSFRERANARRPALTGGPRQSCGGFRR